MIPTTATLLRALRHTRDTDAATVLARLLGRWAR